MLVVHKYSRRLLTTILSTKVLSNNISLYNERICTNIRYKKKHSVKFRKPVQRLIFSKEFLVGLYSVPLIIECLNFQI